MSRQAPRWSWLVTFAVGNLIFWVTIAAAVGIMASDMVDLGIESFLREQQATLVALGKGTPSSRGGSFTLISEATVEATLPPVKVTPNNTELDPVTPSTGPIAATRKPSVKTAMTPYATRTPSMPTAVPTDSEPASTEKQPGNSIMAQPVLPTAVLPSSPILLADPNAATLSKLDADIRRSATGRPVQIRYREAALNQQIGALMDSNPDMPYQNVTAEIERGYVILSADVSIMGLTLPTEVQGTVVAVDCVPKVEIDSIRVGGFMTPSFVKKQVEQLVLESMNWYPEDYPLCLEEIVLETDRATIYGSRR